MPAHETRPSSGAHAPCAFPLAAPADAQPAGNAYRWGQLVMGMVCMAVIANLQYGWTLFVNPLSDKYGWSQAAIQVAFAVFILTQTWLVPIEGYLVDRFGPRPVVIGGGLLCATGWVMNGVADSLDLLYVAAAVSGVGAGAIYGTCVGGALKWFPERRGLAVGLTVASFGLGSVVTVIPTTFVIESRGYEAAFLYFGLGQGLVLMALALMLDDPNTVLRRLPAALAPARVRQSARDVPPGRMVREPVFWVMYAVFVLIAAGGLMATAQLAPIARDFGVDDVPVRFLGVALPALTLALTLDRVSNGVTRLVFGWVSDRIGREPTMVLAFSLEALAILALYRFGTDPLTFVLLSALVFFAWGEIYSLFPAICADTFGSRHAATNAGLLYTAKGVAAVFVPLSSVLNAATGSWQAVFVVAAGMSASAAAVAWFVLRPMRRKLLAASAAGAAGEIR